MQKENFDIESLQNGEACFGFKLQKKEFVKAKNANLYTFEHEKTKAQLLYFDRSDENKTFSISFKTLPQDDTGVFHILEHSVLNGSEKYPVKEPFVSMLQSSMQTFLNAMTYSDKTVFPVSSRNEQDFFNLMSIYLDAVFCPMIYKRPEIFMQEGWHYEFEENEKQPYYNGVVFSEMKGVYSEVDSVIEDETMKTLFPDNSYGFTSGGHPEHITDLTYEQFIETHKRFYHPTNSIIFLDGHMKLDKVLEYIDTEYLSKYDYKENDFDFSCQEPKSTERTVYYEARPEEETLAHLSVSKILCMHDDVEKIYASQILADYLTGSNEAPLKRVFLENALAQDVNLSVTTGIYQPYFALIINNIEKENLQKVKTFLPSAVSEILKNGLNKESLKASLERFAFVNREITEPYGVELCIKALDGLLYGDDALTHIDNAEIFSSLREKIETDYFENLLCEMLASAEDKTYLYVMPSLTKGEDDARREFEKIESETSNWSEEKYQQTAQQFEKMQQWQQSADSEEDIASLPHLDLSDISKTIKFPKTTLQEISGVKVLETTQDTNGIVYLNLYFDLSDFTLEQLCHVQVLTSCIGELSSVNYSADSLQTKIKSLLGSFYAKVEFAAKNDDTENCKTFLLVSASMTQENVHEAVELIKEILKNTCYDEADRIYQIVMQGDYALKQTLLSAGHMLAMKKSLSAFSKKGALTELLEGESFVNWFSSYAQAFMENKDENIKSLSALSEKAFAKNRLFVGYSGKLPKEEIEALVSSFEENEIAAAASYPSFETNVATVEIPAAIGFCAIGHNLNALGKKFSGSCSVLSSLVSYTYLWNMVRVQGGAYGTGMNIRQNGDIYCYSYRDPNVENTVNVFSTLGDFLEEFLSSQMPLDDIIIGTVNTTDPLLEPAQVCSTQCMRYLSDVSNESILKVREEILKTTNEDLKNLIDLVKAFSQSGKISVIADKTSLEFTK